jgi:tRNA/rRNA methyltransferase
LQHELRRLERGARLIRKHLRSGRVALLFGSEKRGLSNADFSHCHWLMRIPTSEEHPSMNLGQAVAICLYELIREKSAVGRPEKLRPATAGQLERITAMLFDALCASGYVKPGAAVSTNEKLRRQVRRLHLQANDAETWLGMLRTFLRKLRSGGS